MRTAWILLIGGSTSLAASCATSPRTRIIVHRGGLPDGTVAGCLNSLEQGITLLELDVRLTKDGQAVILHDPTVDRTTSAKGPIDALSLAEARSLGIPTVAEVLRAVGSRGMVLLELKVAAAAGPVIEAIRAEKALDRAVVRVADRVLLASLRASGVLLGTMGQNPPDGIYAFTPGRNGDLTTEAVANLHARGIVVWATNTNDVEVMRRLIAAGVDGIITDRPDLLRPLLDRP